jgi:hypothetical protein
VAGSRYLIASWGVAVAALLVGAVLATGALAGVSHHNSKLTISRALPLYHGKVRSQAAQCERGRRVVLYEKRAGSDRKVGSDRTSRSGKWKIRVPLAELEPLDRFYAKARRKLNIVSGDGYECRADRSRTRTFVGD